MTQQQAHSLIRSVHAAFAGCHRAAYLHIDGDLSFDALFGRSSALASTLVGDRSPVLIRGHKHASYLVAYWACLLAGRALIPIEPETPALRILDIAESCGAGLVLQTGALPDVDLMGLQLRDVTTFADCADGPPDVVISNDDVAYIMSSSGTSGNPKAIQVTYDNLAGFVRWLRDDLLCDMGFVAVSGNVRHCFDVSLFELWGSWLHHVPISALDHAEFMNSRKYIARYADHMVGLWVSTPSTIQYYLRDRQFTAASLPDLRGFLFCGEVLSKPLVRDLMARFPAARIINTYGPTECTVAVTSVDITADHLAAAAPLPIGVVRNGARLALKDGKIVIGGDCVGPGYINRPAQQAKAFVAHKTYDTGDIGSCDSDGNWYFHGRADREIKLQGVRIDLNEIEDQIRALPGVEVAVVDPHVIRQTPRALNAYVCGPQSRGGLAQLAKTMQDSLPPHMVPRFWYGCSSMPFNQNTKLDRSQLMAAAHTEDMKYVHD